jgi:hypothetical protein
MFGLLTSVSLSNSALSCPNGTGDDGSLEAHPKTYSVTIKISNEGLSEDFSIKRIAGFIRKANSWKRQYIHGRITVVADEATQSLVLTCDTQSLLDRIIKVLFCFESFKGKLEPINAEARVEAPPPIVRAPEPVRITHIPEGHALIVIRLNNAAKKLADASFKTIVKKAKDVLSNLNIEEYQLEEDGHFLLLTLPQDKLIAYAASLKDLIEPLSHADPFEHITKENSQTTLEQARALIEEYRAIPQKSFVVFTKYVNTDIDALQTAIKDAILSIEDGLVQIQIIGNFVILQGPSEIITGILQRADRATHPLSARNTYDSLEDMIQAIK